MLTNEPLYEGEPILAVAAVTEEAAADAIEKVRMDLEPLPFALDPLESLRPGGSNARLEGNTMSGREHDRRQVGNVDWSSRPRTLPMDGEVTDEWEVGDVEAGFAEADLVLDETVFMQSLSHQPLETGRRWRTGRTANAICTCRPRARRAPTASRPLD